MEEIEVVGTPLEVARGRVRPFAWPLTYRLMAHPWVPDWTREWAGKHLGGSPAPVVTADKCNGCQTCVKSCPAEAITMVNDKARIQKESCISCFCCHEMCLQQAITIKVPWFWTAIMRV